MWIVELLLLLYFTYVVTYTLVFAIGGLCYTSPKLHETGNRARFCVLMPAYKEDAVILESVKGNLKQTYSTDFFDIVVIADSLKQETIRALSEFPIKVIPVSFENSTKVKALNKCLSELSEEYDYGVILDADNVMEPTFLERMNDLYQTGDLSIIQGQRKPKNSNNTLSFLDGLSEAINNHIYRQGTTALKMSSSINGSGIAFAYPLLKQKLLNMTSVGGFDRELELLLINDGYKVFYFRDAVVYDEKVSKSQSFKNQRTRWIYSQYFYLAKYFVPGIVSLLKGNFTFFNSAVLRNIQLPRLLNIGLLTVFTVSSLFLDQYLPFGAIWWLLLFAIHALAIFLSIPKEYFTVQLLKAIVHLPIIFVQMILILFKLKGSNKRFIHTPHGLTSTSKENR